VRFVAIATADAGGHADMSPKGDPAGAMLHWDGAHASYAERPGNRRKDSLKNLLERPLLAAVALVPGTNLVATVQGRARLDDTEQARTRFEVHGKTPELVTRIEDARVTLRESAALARAQQWPVATTGHGIDPAAMLTAHIKQNKSGGIAAGLMRRVVSRRLVGAGLAHDYKKRLY
jgi:predicted pyridoxine 5'-phosphate oxidase superfamily flavin-nucleotide-binding protein